MHIYLTCRGCAVVDHAHRQHLRNCDIGGVLVSVILHCHTEVKVVSKVDDSWSCILSQLQIRDTLQNIASWQYVGALEGKERHIAGTLVTDDYWMSCLYSVSHMLHCHRSTGSLPYSTQGVPRHLSCR